MNGLEKAIADYRKIKTLLSLKELSPVEELKFRFFCIQRNYDAEGYSEISSLENFLYHLVKNRTPIDILYTMVSLETIPLTELVEEAEMNRLICSSYNLLIKKCIEQNEKLSKHPRN